MLRRIATLPVPAGQAARRAQEIFGDEIGREKCLRNRLDQRHFWGLSGRETLNRPIRRGWRHRGPKLGQLGQNLAEGGRLVYIRRNRRGKTEVPDQKEPINDHYITKANRSRASDR